MSISIEFIQARQILDSRGNPTVEVDVILEDGTVGRAAVPSGASTGEHEAVELRDDDKKKYLGKGVLKAVANVNTVIAPELIGLDPRDKEAMRAGVEIYHSLKKILHKAKLSTAVGDEGGFAPDLKDNEDALKYIGDAVTAAGYEFGKQVFVALDPAASELWDNEKKGYKFFKSAPDKILTSEQMADYWGKWVEKYPIRSIEDGFAENDWAGWKLFTDRVGNKIQLVGDDLFVTNVKFLEKGISTKTANSILVKVNQIGTLSETFAAVGLAMRNGYSAVLSHRSGETEDSTIADIAVATNCGQIKTGAPARSDRVAKYNQLIRIEEQLGDRAVFGGKLWNKG